jgi:hypothetical protein
MTSGETTPLGDASEPAQSPEPDPSPELGDPGDFMIDIVGRDRYVSEDVEIREGDPRDFSSDRMSTEE